MKMKLKRLEISRDIWGSDPEALKGEITYDSPAGKVNIVLKPEHLEGILAIVADGLVAASKEIATELTANIIENASNRLEAPDE